MGVPRRVVLALGAAVLVLWGLLPEIAPPVHAQGASKRLAVASEAPRAAEEAMAQLQSSGNAVDAAVTAALVAGVVSSSSSGIGGGGFVNYWDAAQGRAYVLDFREVAPQDVSAPAFEARPFEFDQRGKAVGVPGEVMGLYEFHRRFGRLNWEQVVLPAVQVAERGFTVERHLDNALGFSVKRFRNDPGMRSLWLRAGKRFHRGHWMTNPRLGKTLQRIAREGPKAFYEGSIAAEIVKTVRAAGGSLTMGDLASYSVKEREPLMIEWEGNTIYTMPPPSAGGFMLAQTLHLYDADELRPLGVNSPAYMHALAEAFRAAISDRLRYFGDPDFVNVDLGMLLGEERMRRRRARIALDRTHALPRFGLEEHGTHHLVTADAQGNVVSMTVTVNTAFGADLMTERSGIVLNDELDDFSKDAWVKAFGLSKSLNRPRPGARPVSSMTPTLVVREGKVVLAAGGSGGFNIATDVSQTILHQLLFDKSPKEVVAAPRFQIPLFGASLRVPKVLGAKFIEDLSRRGEVVQTYDKTFTGVQMIRIQNGVKSAAADPQKHGRAIVR